MTDVWKISQQEINSLRIQAQELYKPLKGTSYFAQGATLYSDIIASLDDATNIQNQAQTPEERIKAYREALTKDINKVKNEIDNLKTLDTSAGSNGNLLGFVGGVQTAAVWGLVLILTAGFVFLAIYMRTLMTNASKPGEKEKTEFSRSTFLQSGEKIKNFKKRFNRKTAAFMGVAACLVLAILLSAKMFLPGALNNRNSGKEQSFKNLPAKNTADVSPNGISSRDGKKVLGIEAVSKNQVVILTANTSGINLRQGPSTLTKILRKITADTIVNKINSLNGWTEIEIDNSSSKSASLRGWVKDDYIGSVNK